MKHALIVNHNAGSPHHGPNFRSYYAAQGWVEQGMKVTIVCSSFSHKLSRLPEVPGDHLFETIDGIRYLWLKTKPFAGNVGRLRNYLEFQRRLQTVPDLVTEPVDYVVCSSPPPLWIWFCRRLARLKNAALIFEARDLWPDVIFETSPTGRVNPAAWLMRLGELTAYKHADAVVSVNESAIKVMKNRGLDPDRFHAIQNGTALTAVEDRTDPPAADLCRRLQAEGQTVVGYSGALSRIYGLSYLLEAAEALRDEPFAFVLAGTGPFEAELKRHTASLPNLHLVGWIPKDDLQGFLRSVDICYAGLLNVRSFVFGSDSTKVYEYMKAARPVLHSIGDKDSVVAQAGCGLRVIPEDGQAMADGLRELVKQGSGQLDELGAAGKRYLEDNRSYGVLTAKWMKLFASLDRA